MSLYFKKLSERAVPPTRAHPSDAGLDLYSVKQYIIEPGSSVVVETDLALEIEFGHVGLICDRSSMALNGLTVCGGVVDSGYRGPVRVILWNISNMTQVTDPRQRVAQLLLMPVYINPPRESVELSDSARGKNGFGSTGV